MTTIHRTLNVPATQRERARADQVPNSEGAFVFQLDPLAQLERFLVLGTEGGTFYASERKLTRESMSLVEAVVTNRDIAPRDLIELIINRGNVAPKRTYALYALAVCLSAGTLEHKRLVQTELSNLVKTGTDLFEFVSYIEALRGWGPAARKAVGGLIMRTNVEKLGLWSVKYRDRYGFTWRDVLRLSHPKSKNDEDQRRAKLFDFMLGKASDVGILPVDGYQIASGRSDVAISVPIVELVRKYGLPWEALTDEQRTDDVWKACLPFIGEQAVLRNLASFTRRGMLNDRGFLAAVEVRLASARKLHPLKVLDAMKTYGSGGAVGRSRAEPYTPVPRVIDALDKVLEESFTHGIRATGNRVYLGVDVSPSMSSLVSGSAVLSCSESAMAVALGLAKNEPDYQIHAFSSAGRGMRGSKGMREVPITARSSFRDALRFGQADDWSGTDCALPMIHANDTKMLVDTFIIITDNETHSGTMHPFEALKQYRKNSGIAAKLAVVAMTSTGFSIADPKDQGMMDFVGFSADLPAALEAFMRL